MLDFESTTYDSVRAAARAVQCPNSTIFKKLKLENPKPYKNRDTFKKKID